MEQAKIRNIDCDKLPSLKRVLEKWISLNREMANAKAFKDHNRVPWWFNERAAVSVLAGAVCKCGNGHYAFEEFIDKKHRTHKPSSKYKGRVDLHINLRGEEFIAEAKFSRTKSGNRR